ncbi:MAG TPA: FCD domain-containing protein, partial [Candidatus Lustribacter sp.]|nr:FCD domain-containing protein [Candidatus Lustribacter sp.]
FPHGRHLPPERVLAERLGVARMTLREAIAALRQSGMVQTTRGRAGGTVVIYRGPDIPSAEQGPAQPSVRRGADLLDALQFRRVVEPGVAFLAASRSLSADQRAWLVQAEADVRGASTPGSHRVADARLHLAIATLCGSPMLIEAVTRAQAAVHELLSAIPVLPRNIDHSNADHARIVAAILAGQADVARLTMEAHCDATSALLRGLLG